MCVTKIVIAIKKNICSTAVDDTNLKQFASYKVIFVKNQKNKANESKWADRNSKDYSKSRIVGHQERLLVEYRKNLVSTPIRV